MQEQIKVLEEKRAALVAQSKKSEDVAELKSLNQQIATINDVLATLRSAKPNSVNDEEEDERTKAVNDPNAKVVARSPLFVPGKGFFPAEEGNTRSLNTTLEQRIQAGKDLKENRSVKSPLSIFGELRAVTVNPPSGQDATIVVPNTYSSTVNPDFPVVSSLVDAVAHLSLDGGNSFTQAYVAGIDTGNYTTEGANAASAETKFAYAEINKTKITAYAELTEELQNLPAAPYADIVFQNIRTSMRKLLAKEILVGAGGTNQLVGIFSDKATAIDSATDLGMSQITDTTLDDILFKFGGEEDVEDPAVLILNKADLLNFAKVRTSTKQKFYDIRINGNGGTISGVPFIINSACKSLMAATTVAGDYCMAYGNLSNYQLVEFSPMIVKRSDDYKFPAGMTAYRGVCWFGGNVTRRNGFIRIKKASS